MSEPGSGPGDGRYDEIVQFGTGRSARARWLPRLLLACLVLAAAVALIVRGAAEPARPKAHTPAVSPPPMLEQVTGHRLLGVTAGWELFARGPDDLVRIQLAQGRVMQTFVPRLDSASPDVAFLLGAHDAVIKSSDYVPGYVVPDGREARQLPAAVESGGPMIAGPAGTQAFWLGDLAPPASVFSLTTITGHPSGPVIRFAAGGPQLAATATPDGRGDVLLTSGNTTVYDAGPGWDRPVPGMVVAVGPSSWLVMTCPVSYRHCREHVISSTTWSSRSVPGSVAAPPAPYTWPPLGTIAPDGRMAAVGQFDHSGPVTVGLLNLRSGRTTDLRVPLGSTANAESMAWSPDSRWLFVAGAGGRLVVIDARTDRPADLGVQLPPVDQVAIRS